MTTLSVNINKIALLRNSRGRDFPQLLDFARQLLDLGCKGITVHPRPDARHITRADTYALAELLHAQPEAEFNIEGYPTPDFLSMVLELKPDQCTLVPDAPQQLTSDHGWDIAANRQLLTAVLPQLRARGIRSSLFMEPSVQAIAALSELAAPPSVPEASTSKPVGLSSTQTAPARPTATPPAGAPPPPLAPETTPLKSAAPRPDRIELYTEAYARAYPTPRRAASWQQYRAAARQAQSLGLGVNAGHDLDLSNLACFLQIPGILEVSIGHALIVEAIQQGLPQVIAKYHAITGG